MLRKISGVMLVCLFFAVGSLSAQQKRSLTHEDYDGWESLSSNQMTKDGKWVGYMISPQEGDGRLEILPFKDVGDAHAAKEMVGDGSLEYWQDVYWDLFDQVYKGFGDEADEEMDVVCESFEVIKSFV